MVLRCKLHPSSLLIFSLLCLSNCALPLARLAPPIIKDDLDAQSLRAAIRNSTTYLQKLPPDRLVGEAPQRLTAKDVLDSLQAFEPLLEVWSCAACLNRELAARFELVPSSVDPGLSEVLYTGYYQPMIDASLTPTEEYRYPIYGQPPDLVIAEPANNGEKNIGRVEQDHFVPYYSRQEIDQFGALQGRGLEIAWVKDPVELFFLHIQGSGLLRLTDGTVIHVGYAAQNGRPYRSIGRLLIDTGKVAQDEMSMQRLRRYLADNPQEQNEIFAYNESYVFFRLVPNGPLGSLEVPVTPGRSIATDSRLFPKGALALIQTDMPIIGSEGQLAGWRPVTRFVLNQDTGGAIRGLQRADIYFGPGEEAAGPAGFMNRAGKIYFLVLKKDHALHGIDQGAKKNDE